MNMNSEPVYASSDITVTTPRVKTTASVPSFWTFWNIATIAGGVAAIVFVTSIIIIIVVLCKRRRESVHEVSVVEYPDLCTASSTFFLSVEDTDNEMLAVNDRNADNDNRRSRNPGRHVNKAPTSVSMAPSTDNISQRPSECLESVEDEVESPVVPRKKHGGGGAFGRQLSEQTVDRHGAGGAFSRQVSEQTVDRHGSTVDKRQSESEAIYDVPKIAIKRIAYGNTLVWTRDKGAGRKSSTPSGDQRKSSRSGVVYDIPRNLSVKRSRIAKSSQ
ncbi:uncharacterized protein LOC112569514 [Pomacea canaliculata]|uniref:uncharacterized protein LOC112569514 n=1 Tax=Pomacea canaliculata TaxID=400727 RepID=UPI000D7326C3|nr:uncharacterized protein LOC112569514 [Pomacea canaliculata]XP_025103106.1 uncharacterized protein LOC112569514 [Pomacea canaliculata]